MGWLEGVSLREIDGLYYRQQKARLRMDACGLQSGSSLADDDDRGFNPDKARADMLRAFAGRCRLTGADR